VHLAIPDKEVFVRQSADPTASVFLQLARGRSLGRSQVEAIVHLVSSSVPNLTKENVAVVDQNGSLLSRSSNSAESQLSDSQLEHRIKLEDIYRARVTSLLTPIVGAGNINAQINLDIDFTRSEVTEELVDPQGNALRSEQLTSDQTMQAPAKGIPGAIANTPPAAETGLEIAKPLNEAELARIEKLVADAIGIDIERGDSLTVSSAPYVDMLMEGVIIEWYEKPFVRDAINQFGFVLMLGIVILGIVRPLINRILVPAVVPGMQGAPGGDDEIDIDTVEVGEGESLEDIKAKLKPKKAAISAEMLDTANTYDDKVAVIRMIVSDEAGRVSNVFKAMMSKDIG
jgi:flagellar M-ring protein FliF